MEVKKDGATIAQFTYDGDGKRVKSVEGAATILFVGGHYEVKGSEITKYYFAGASRIAMRTNGMLNWLVSDHVSINSTTARFEQPCHRCAGW